MKKKWSGVISVFISMMVMLGTIEVAEARELVDPPVTEWGCKLKSKDIQNGIAAGLAGRGWMVTKAEPGKVHSRLLIRKHTLDVVVIYTSSTFDINYVSSDNLRYKKTEDGAEIHKNANSWMDNINNDIRAQLSTRCIMQ